MSQWSHARATTSDSATTNCAKMLSSSPSKKAYGESTSQLKARAKASLYKDVSARDHASQHIGDRFYAPVTFQHAATAHDLEESGDEEGYLALLRSLAFGEMDSRYMAVHPHLFGTCEWLLAAPEYKMWKDADLMSVHNGFLWIKGKAGAGKSTLMKFASGRAEASCVEGEHVLTFFFNARGGPPEISTDGLFRSLLEQILEKVPRLYVMLDQRRLNLFKRQGWSPALLKDLFREAVMSLCQDRVTCFIDAMDECRDEDVEDIIRFFDDLGDSVVAQTLPFHVCLSSRHYPNLRLSKKVELNLEHQYGHDRDIQEYLQRRLVIDNEKLKEDLVKSITAKAMGVFLWVVLVVALVNRDDRRGNAQEIYKHFDQIPRQLSNLFTDLIERSAHHEHFHLLLQWVTFHQYPLNPRSLYCALMHTTEPASQDGIRPLSLDPIDIAKFMLDSSKGLVETTLDDRVQFIHESLRTYFLGEGVGYLTSETVAKDLAVNGSGESKALRSAATTAHCHNQLKERCLQYLVQIFPLLHSTPRSSELSNLEARITTAFPFFRYALYGTLSHANTAQNLGIQQQTFLDALPWDKIGLLCQVVRAPFKKEWEPASIAPWYKAYVAARLGHFGLLKVIFETLPRSEVKPRQWGAILRTPMENLNVQGVSMILKAGAGPNAIWDDWKPCLWHAIQAAASMDDRDRFALSDRDSEPDRDVDHSDSDRANAFEIVKLFLKYGAKSYPTRVNAFDCIHQACERREWGFLRVLSGEHMVEEDMKMVTQSQGYKVSLASALGTASCDGDDAIVKFLIRKGAETALWSHGRVKTRADGKEYIEVTFKEEWIVRKILDNGAQVFPSAAIQEERGDSFEQDIHAERPRNLLDLFRSWDLYTKRDLIEFLTMRREIYWGTPLSFSGDTVTDHTLYFMLWPWSFYSRMDLNRTAKYIAWERSQYRWGTLLWVICGDYRQYDPASARTTIETTKKMLVELNGLPQRLFLYCSWLLTTILAKVSAYMTSKLAWIMDSGMNEV